MMLCSSSNFVGDDCNFVCEQAVIVYLRDFNKILLSLEDWGQRKWSVVAKDGRS